MDKQSPHLLIEEGPEKGREITIPAAGARIGRAEENDIRIADAAMSRFQCRMYFREGFLHAMDLGSTNETLVNNQPVSDVALRFGDELLIGESLIKVINDGLHENNQAAPVPPPGEPETAEPAPAPIIFNMGDGKPGAEPAGTEGHDNRAPSVMDVDLGLGRREDLEEAKQKGERGSGISLLIVALVTLAVIVPAMLFFIRNAPPPPVTVEEDKSLQIHYEKVISGDGNIFRYSLDLEPDGKLTVMVHDLLQERRTVREERIDSEQITGLREQLYGNKDSLMALQGEYEGLSSSSGVSERYRLTVIFGKEAKTVRVANQLEPDAFKQVRERIEAFANNVLGLINPQIPPEVLRANAAESWENAQQLYEARNVKNGNLWEATQKLKDVANLLESIEPKPDYYRDAVTLRQEWRKLLLDRVTQLEFESIRAYQLGEKERAAELTRLILRTFPERSHPEYKQAYNRLTQIEEELNR